MKTIEITTSDLGKFGSREIAMCCDLLNAWVEQGLPNGFYNEEVRPEMNKNSGHVFLTNSEYKVAMMNGDKLEIWYHCSNCGCEGFRGDFKEAFSEDGECEACTIERNEREEG